MIECKICGGDCKEKSRNGSRIVYECLCCGNVFEQSSAPCDSSNNGFSGGYVGYGATVSGNYSANMGNSGESVYDKNERAVVEIIVRNDKSAAVASGFFVSSNGFVVTNSHAVLDSSENVYSEVYVKYRQKLYQARVVAVGLPLRPNRPNTVDLALLFVPNCPKDARAVEFGDSDAVKNGQSVYIMGNSLGQGTCITSGIVSDRARKLPGLDNYSYIMTDAASNHGNSGGLLLDSDGKVVGVPVAGIDGAKGMNYAIPSNIVKQFLSYAVKESKLNPDVFCELSTVVANRYAVGNQSIGFATVITGIKLFADVIGFIYGLIRR